MEYVLGAIQNVFLPINLFAVFVGTFAGIVIGALPGLSTVMGLSILLPFTLSFSGMGGMYMLLGVFCGGIYGGSISASLLNTPGTSASAATALDGYPMANKLGQPGRALGISTFASLFGGLFSAICLCIFAPMLAKVALKFSAQEYFALAVFGISIVAGLTGKSVIKGVIGGVIGLLLATIGIDGMGGVSRFTFGSVYLMGGVSFIPLLIGLFAFSQGLNTVEEMAKGYKAEKNKVKIEHVFPSKADLKRIFPTLIRSSIIGTFIGAVPGTGGDIASWVSYSQAKTWSKHKEEFGHGSPEGIAASESGNNAISGGAFVPLLSMGIPGDAGTAVMLGSLTMLGLAPGPLLFTEHKDSVYSVRGSVCGEPSDGYPGLCRYPAVVPGAGYPPEDPAAPDLHLLLRGYLRLQPQPQRRVHDDHCRYRGLCAAEDGLFSAAHHSGCHSGRNDRKELPPGPDPIQRRRGHLLYPAHQLRVHHPGRRFPVLSGHQDGDRQQEGQEAGGCRNRQRQRVRVLTHRYQLPHYRFSPHSECHRPPPSGG